MPLDSGDHLVRKNWQVIFTTLVLIVAITSILFVRADARPTKLNEWGDYFAGIGALIAAIWVIATYQHAVTEFKDITSSMRATRREDAARARESVFEFRSGDRTLEVINRGDPCILVAAFLDSSDSDLVAGLRYPDPHKKTPFVVSHNDEFVVAFGGTPSRPLTKCRARPD